MDRSGPDPWIMISGAVSPRQPQKPGAQEPHRSGNGDIRGVGGGVIQRKIIYSPIMVTITLVWSKVPIKLKYALLSRVLWP